MKKASIAILVVLALLIGLVAGFYSAGMSKGSVSKAGTGAQKGNYKDTFADGWRAAKEKLEASALFNLPGMTDNKIISGTVKEVANGKVVVETALRNPLDDEALKTRSVSLSGSKISVRMFRSSEEIDRVRKASEIELKSINDELNALEKKLSSCQPASVAVTNDPCADDRAERDELFKKSMEVRNSMMNEYYDVQNPSVNDIKPGYFVTVTAAEDVSGKVEFNAVSVTASQNIREANQIMPPAASNPSSATSPAATPSVVPPPATETPVSNNPAPIVPSTATTPTPQAPVAE